MNVTVYRQGNYWYARHRAGDQVERHCLGNRNTLSKGEATAKAVAWADSLATEAAGTTTLGELVTTYFQARAGDLQPATLRSHRRTADLLESRLGKDTRLDDLSKLDFVGLRTWLLNQGYAENTVRKRTKEARTILEFAVQMELIDSNPATGRMLPTSSRKANRRDRRVIEDNEIERVLEQVKDPRWQLAIGLAAWAGLRRHEVFKTKANALDLGNQALTVWSDKTSSERITRVEFRLVELLEQVSQGRTTDLLADLERGYNQGYARLRQACLAAGVEPFTWQELRASRATTWRREGHPASAVNQWMGHSEGTATDHYVGEIGTAGAARLDKLAKDNQALRQEIARLTTPTTEQHNELRLAAWA